MTDAEKTMPHAPEETISLEEAITRAVGFHRAGEVQEAERLYRAVLGAYPRHPDANHNLGVLAIQMNKPEAGLPFLAVAHSEQPDRPDYLASYVQALTGAGRSAEALEVLGAGMARGVQSPGLRALAQAVGLSAVQQEPAGALARAIAEQEIGRYGVALGLLRNLVQAEPENSAALAQIAYIKLLSRRIDEAVDMLQRACAISPDHPVVQRNHARALIARGLAGQAIVTAEKALAAEPADMESRLVLATAYIASGSDAAAAVQIDEILRSRPAYAEALLQRTGLRMRAGDIAGALRDVTAAAALKPHIATAWRLIANLFLHVRQQHPAVRALQYAHALEPDTLQDLVVLGEIHRQMGAWEKAVEILEQAVAQNDAAADAWANLGTAYHQGGEIARARAAYAKALFLAPSMAQISNNLGVLAKTEGRWDEALRHFTSAVVSDPSNASFLMHRAVAVQATQRQEETEKLARWAMMADPRSFEAGHLRVVALCALRRGGEAARVLPTLRVLVAGDKGRSLRCLTASAAVARLNGDEAEEQRLLQEALTIAPNYRPAIIDLCRSRVNAGIYPDALPLATQLLNVDLSDEAARSLFVSCARRISWGRFEPDIHSYLVQALEAPWCAPSMVTASVASMVKIHPLLGEFLGEAMSAWSEDRRPAAPSARLVQHLAQDKLFAALLSVGPNTDPGLEMVLTVLRRHLLMRAGDGQELMADDLALLALIARQSFTNEFVFWESDEEAATVAGLKTRVEDGIGEGRPARAADILMLAGYLALSEIAGAAGLAAVTWPEAVQSIIHQQIVEPAQERDLAGHVEMLTPIENEISRVVRAQYEESPYPRWLTPVPVGAATSIEAYLRAKFPHAPIRPIPGGESPEILVAGCGTGQHSLMTSQMYHGARVLAVDLSRQSLGYAARKSREAGAEVTYAQADLLQLPALGRYFDAIESVGVLHHLADPLAGWEALVSMLRPGGSMVLGFYSEIARRTLPAAATLVAGNLSDVTSDDIRRARRAIIAGPDKHEGSPLRMGDFYATSSCRDLLFHVQEHRMTLPGISDFLTTNGLTFLGFNLPTDRLHAYRTRYPEDTACRDLSNWEAFERQHPTTFLDMYQFWVQKA